MKEPDVRWRDWQLVKGIPLPFKESVSHNQKAQKKTYPDETTGYGT
jgi:hypothetical protein